MRPHDNSEMYDVIVLGTMRSPGVVRLSGHDRNEKWDIKEAKGTTSATTTLNGDPIGQFEATFYLADDGYDGGPSDFDRWEDFQRLVESTTNGPKPIALPIFHPDLARNRITDVVNGGVGGMVHDGKGGATVKVKFLEYRPPKPKPPKKPGSGTGTRIQEKPDPNAEAKRQLAALFEQAKQP